MVTMLPRPVMVANPQWPPRHPPWLPRHSRWRRSGIMVANASVVVTPRPRWHAVMAVAVARGRMCRHVCRPIGVRSGRVVVRSRSTVAVAAVGVCHQWGCVAPWSGVWECTVMLSPGGSCLLQVPVWVSEAVAAAHLRVVGMGGAAAAEVAAAGGTVAVRKGVFPIQVAGSRGQARVQGSAAAPAPAAAEAHVLPMQATGAPVCVRS